MYFLTHFLVCDFPGALKVLVYEHTGAKGAFSCSSGDALHSPSELAAADVVLTTYDTLQRDLHRHNAEDSKYSLRRPKKYQVPHTQGWCLRFTSTLQPLVAWLRSVAICAWMGARHVGGSPQEGLHLKRSGVGFSAPAVVGIQVYNTNSKSGHVLKMLSRGRRIARPVPQARCLHAGCSRRSCRRR